MITYIILGMLALLLSAGLFLCNALLLRLGLRWARANKVNNRRVLLALALMLAIQLGVALVLFHALAFDPFGTVLFVAIEGLLAIVAPCLVIAVLFKLNPGRSFVAWLPTLLLNVGIAFILSTVLFASCYHAFKISNNAMAPTLLGNYCEATCPVCGETAFCSPDARGYERSWTNVPRPMICRNFHTSLQTLSDQEVFHGDLILANKVIEPRRWDIVVFQYPEHPSTYFVMRLVGMPGEEIVIKDGAVWADGQMLTPPKSIEGIDYASEMPGYPDLLWGTEDRPANLAEDEYFVLGDFSVQSKDSRLWSTGAPGHPPYVVPRSHLYGVVTHVYWPPERCRALRGVENPSQQPSAKEKPTSQKGHNDE